jgi:hypothetical protein
MLEPAEEPKTTRHTCYSETAYLQPRPLELAKQGSVNLEIADTTILSISRKS